MQPLSSTAGAPVLHLLCGKIGAGKSTLARQLAAQPRSVLISEDTWLATLYPGEIHSIADYQRRAATLRGLLADHVRALLQAGLSVVLDVPFNTPATRAWGRAVFESAAVAHQLHFLDVADATCKARLRARNARGEHPFQASDEAFELITRHFVAPTAEEGFVVIHHMQEE